MTIYAALLRGINVNGRRMMKMERLRCLFESMGFVNVKTYIQSGNVIFLTTGDDDVVAIHDEIERALAEAFGEIVPVMIRTISELEQVVQQNPFGEKVFVGFLSGIPLPASVEKLLSYNGVDQVCVNGREVYIHCTNGFHKTVFSNHLIEKQLNLSSTIRNWNTVMKLVSLGRDSRA